MGPLIPNGKRLILEDAVTYLESYGFHGVPGGVDWPRLEIQVHGHNEMSAHTWYNIQCVLIRPGMASADWHTSKRLMQLREGLRNMLRAELGKEKMEELFASTPFARRGGLPGTTALLTTWCQKLAELISTGEIPLPVVAGVMRFLDAPEDLYYDSTSMARSLSFMSAESDEDDFPVALTSDSQDSRIHSQEFRMKDTSEHAVEVPTMAGYEDVQSMPVEDSDIRPCNRTRIPFGDGPGHVKDGDATQIQVRGRIFHQTKEKENSLPAFYELVHVELLKPPSDGEVNTNVASMGVLNALQATGTAPEGVLPKYFILNLQLPSGAPPGPWSKTVQSCSSLVLGFRVRSETQAAAAIAACDPALELFKRYCSNASQDFSLQSKLKLIGRAENLPIPSMLASTFARYNGKKPAIITRSGYLISGPEYLEMDVDVRKFCWAARQALYQVWDSVSEAKITLAAVVQGDHDMELPERVFGCATLNRLDLPQLTGVVT
eukprot:gnl/MRDRNA2_/MRDRNA2_28589_c0_seq1.p1 gnl/MRDRNA2_/MRDRNA2_28589_c0~~gnl/MRDRNA2_/MRDRNA2_28589_c0_seq1.p1  ORF type:complete len:527 (+),score=76.84 gnl/MRDRNA2_/MRDRNA2_28589_c0_seq1:111-1583(+)